MKIIHLSQHILLKVKARERLVHTDSMLYNPEPTALRNPKAAGDARPDRDAGEEERNQAEDQRLAAC